MVIDDCEEKPDNFPHSCKGCPWSGRCKFTNIECDCRQGKLLEDRGNAILILCEHNNYIWIEE